MLSNTSIYPHFTGASRTRRSSARQDGSTELFTHWVPCLDREFLNLKLLEAPFLKVELDMRKRLGKNVAVRHAQSRVGLLRHFLKTLAPQ